jgi:hypothetical protein
LRAAPFCISENHGLSVSDNLFLVRWRELGNEG